MKSQPATELLDALAARAQQNIVLLEQLARLPDKSLHLRPRPKAWTALEALQHLNVFNHEYFRRTKVAIDNGQPATGREFTSSWLGRVAANWARPGAKTIKLPALKKMNPRKRKLDRRVVDHCLKNEQLLATMIEDARSIDLITTKITTTELPLVKLRIGDALRLFVNHDWRHLEQAERATRGEAGIRTT